MADYRLLRISQSGYYRNLYQQALTADELTTLPYEECVQRLRERGFLYPGHLAEGLQALGGQVIDVVADYTPLQSAWARSVGREDLITLSKHDFLLRQIENIKPDILYFQDFTALPHAMRKQLKIKFPWLKVVTGFQGFPMKSYQDFKDLDLIFISYPAYHEAWRQVGVPSHTLYHCFDAYGWSAPMVAVANYDFVFVGSSGYGSPYHQGRYRDLAYLLRSTNLELWGHERDVHKGYEYMLAGILWLLSSLPASILSELQHVILKPHQLTLLIRDAQRIHNKLLPAWPWYLGVTPLSTQFPTRCHPPAYGQEYMKVLQQAKVVLNRHTDEPGEGGNIRTFEVTGLGSCLLTDTRPNISDLFVPDEEIAVYTTAVEAADKARYLLDHSKERQQMAAKAKARVEREHMTHHRCAVIHTRLLDVLQKKV